MKPTQTPAFTTRQLVAMTRGLPPHDAGPVQLELPFTVPATQPFGFALEETVHRATPRPTNPTITDAPRRDGPLTQVARALARRTGRGA